MFFTSPLMIGEFPSSFGAVGILLIICGSYLLNVSKFKDGIFEPFKALFNSSGPRYMLATAFFWSITRQYRPGRTSLRQQLCLGVSSLSGYRCGVCRLIWTSQGYPGIPEALKLDSGLVSAGAATAAMIICHMTAISYGLVVYAVTVKRLSIVFSSIWGAVFLGEQNLRERFLGICFMLAGVSVLALT